jgi:hypothetical protein
MVYGKGGNFGMSGNIESETYREGRVLAGSNPTLSAIKSLYGVRFLIVAMRPIAAVNNWVKTSSGTYA